MAHQPDLGIENPYALDETQFQAAVDLLKEQRPHISEYWSDYLKEIWRSRPPTRWSARRGRSSRTCSRARARRPTVVLPEEGATGWSDTWMIASEAKSPNCAYAWLD